MDAMTTHAHAHETQPDDDAPEVGGIAAGRLRSFIERIERLHEERSGIAHDISEVFAEAKGDGFDTKVMKEVIRLRRMDKAAYQEFDTLVDLYKHAMGMG